MHSPSDCTLIIPSAETDIITLRLHTRYLVAKSLFLRGLLGGVSPSDLIRHLAPSRAHPSVPVKVPRASLPRLMPSPPSHPVLFLPVPDPCSIQPLFLWMYTGSTDIIEHALDRGLIQWQGLARNVEYLCLPTDIKVFLGRWYRSSFLPSSPESSPASLLDDDDRSDVVDSDDSDSYDYLSSSSADDDVQSDDECDRGRARDIKPLIQLCGQLRLCTA